MVDKKNPNASDVNDLNNAAPAPAPVPAETPATPAPAETPAGGTAATESPIKSDELDGLFNEQPANQQGEDPSTVSLRKQRTWGKKAKKAAKK